MERFNKKIYSGTPLTFPSLILIIILNLFSFSLVIADENELSNITMKKFVSPKYNEETSKLEYILIGKHAQTVGVFLKITDARVEMIGKNGEKVTSVITSPEAFYNKDTQIIRGDKSIHYQSLAATVDGIGFDCNMKTQLLHIRNDVRMLITSVKHLQGEKTETDDQYDIFSEIGRASCRERV